MALSKTLNPENTVQNISIIDGDEEYEEIQMGVKSEDMWVIIQRMTDLYPNADMSTVREIISNAIDATVILPEDERLPIKIQRPSVMNPVFIVEDFGVGMSFDVLKNVYANYASSTKRNDFRQIGAYGLGAKSPLAYCEEFYITTTHNGITIEAAVKRTERGNSVKPISIIETGAHSGTKITIPVRASNITGFFNHVENYMKFITDDYVLEVDGKIVTNSNEDYIPFDNFCLDEDADVWGRVWANREYLVQNYVNHLKSDYSFVLNFAYVLSGWLYRDPSSSYYDFSTNPNFIVEIKPGVVNFDSSRDSINSDERFSSFKKRLVSKYSEVDESSIQKIMEAYRRLSTPRDALSFVHMCRSKGVLPNHGYALGEKVSFTVSNSSTMKTATVEYSLDDFTINGGFNPMDLYLESSDEEFYAALQLGSKNQAGQCYKVSASVVQKPNTEYDSFVVGFMVCNTVSESNTMLRDVVKYGVALPMTRVFTDNMSLSYGASMSSVFSESVNVVYGVTEDFIEEFIKQRRCLEKHSYQNTHFLFTKKPVNDAFVKNLEALGTKFTQFSVAEFTEEITKCVTLEREERRSRQSKPKKMGKTVEGYTYIENIRESIEFVSGGVRQQTIDLQEAMSNGDVILVTHHKNGYYSSKGTKIKESARQAIYGLLNSDVGVIGRKLHLVYASNFTAQQYTEMLNYEHVFFTLRANYKCGAFNKLQVNRRYGDNFLISERLNISEGELLQLIVLKDLNFHSNNVQYLTDYLPDNSTAKTALMKMKVGYYHSTNGFSEMLQNQKTCEVIKKKVGDDVFDAAVKINRSLKNEVNNKVRSQFMETVFASRTFSGYSPEILREDEVFTLLMEKVAENIMAEIEKNGDVGSVLS